MFSDIQAKPCATKCVAGFGFCEKPLRDKAERRQSKECNTDQDWDIPYKAQSKEAQSGRDITVKCLCLCHLSFSELLYSAPSLRVKIVRKHNLDLTRPVLKGAPRHRGLGHPHKVMKSLQLIRCFHGQSAGKNTLRFWTCCESILQQPAARLSGTCLAVSSKVTDRSPRLSDDSFDSLSLTALNTATDI